MKKENTKQNILRVLVLALVFLFAGFPLGAVCHAQEARPQATLSVTLPLVQIFATSGGEPYQTNQQVGYALTGDTAGTPMPAGSTGNRYDLTMTGNSTGSIVIDYPVEGTFQYTINEKIPSGFEYGWTPTKYQITVYAYDGEPIVIMKNDAGEKVSELHWSYVYELPTPSPSPSSSASPAPSVSPSPSASPAPSVSPSSSASSASSVSPAPPSDSSGNGADGGPKTGDESQWSLWVMLAAAAGVVILICGCLSARRHE